jgi:hypothetical protein
VIAPPFLRLGGAFRLSRGQAMNIVEIFFVMILFLAAVQVLVPLAFGMIDKLLISVLLAPFRLRGRWKQVPLHERNRVRATFGAAALIGCAAFALKGFPLIGARATMGLAALALLYLVVGVKGSHGAQYDFMSAFWYAASAIGGVALLIFIRAHGW